MASSQKLKLETSHTSTTFNPQVSWVPKFMGVNYEQWSVQMKSIFIAQGIWDIIQHGRPQIPNDDDEDEEVPWDETKRESYNLNTRRDHYALSIIHRGVDETILPDILDAKTAWEAWRILETTYKKLKQMEESTEQVEIAIPDVTDAVAISLLEKESTICLKPKCCIFKVPDYVKRGNEECYEPSVISMGPVFYRDPRLENMQELKLILLKCFREHPDNACQNLDRYIMSVREKEEEIRECYQHRIRLSSDEFIEMIVLDAAFLIYMFMIVSRSDDRPSRNTPVPFMNELHRHDNYILRDLFLMENQLPFFVLTRIYDIAFDAVYPRVSLIDLALGCMLENTANGMGMPMLEAITSIISGNKIVNASSVKHLLHLRRMCCYLEFTNPRVEEDEQPFVKIGTATQLSAAGVKFKSNERENLFDITFDKSNGELKIPKLSLLDGSDVLFRNILIFEQFGYWFDAFYFFDCIMFFDQLIDSGEDVQILQKNGILVNGFGTDEELANLFNNVLKNLPSRGSGYLYAYVNKDLKEYSSRRRNKWKAILWRKYLTHPWAIISVAAAVILLILTVLQTITGFLQLD